MTVGRSLFDFAIAFGFKEGDEAGGDCEPGEMGVVGCLALLAKSGVVGCIGKNFD